MIGRVADRRATSTNPAFSNAPTSPVQAKASAIGPFLGATGYPSKCEAPRAAAWAAAARRSRTVTPWRRQPRAMKKQGTDQTGVSSTGARTRERPSPS